MGAGSRFSGSCCISNVSSLTQDRSAVKLLMALRDQNQNQVSQAALQCFVYHCGYWPTGCLIEPLKYLQVTSKGSRRWGAKKVEEFPRRLGSQAFLVYFSWPIMGFLIYFPDMGQAFSRAQSILNSLTLCCFLPAICGSKATFSGRCFPESWQPSSSNRRLHHSPM